MQVLWDKPADGYDFFSSAIASVFLSGKEGSRPPGAFFIF
jgi:hypothetical protein